jgi:hypothetical protein
LDLSFEFLTFLDKPRKLFAMYIVTIAWIYVTLMMAVAEATNSNGTLLGACITFLLYGALPISIILYLMRAPARRRIIKAREREELATSVSITPNTHSKTATDPIAPMREKT